jgi:hypothetical protein
VESFKNAYRFIYGLAVLLGLYLGFVMIGELQEFFLKNCPTDQLIDEFAFVKCAKAMV